MKFSLTTQFKNPLDTFKIARYNILTEYKNALIGISTCAAVVQREGKNGGIPPAVYGESLPTMAWKASGSIPFEKKNPDDSLAEASPDFL